MNPKIKETNTIIRVFYALVTILIGVMVAYFVYQNTVNSATKYPFKLGLDLSGGSHLVYEADTSGVADSEVAGLMSVLRDVIERRVNVFGVSEPIVQVESSSFVSSQSSERLVVELPGVTDVEKAVEEIGKTPLLEFKLVSMPTTTKATVDENGVMQANIGEPVYINTDLSGRYLKSASLQFLGQNNTSGGLSNEAVVAIDFNDEGAQIFADITRNHIGENLAIFLDGEVISAPRINEEISGGKATISGNFTPDEAKSLAENLNFGALPVPITLVSTESIGASLGGDVLDKGIMAGMVGLGFVVLFMLFWYRVPGIVASLSLFFYVAIMLALFQLIPVTLTAAGLAGFVLSLGMAVDANVLVFERIKEEYRAGNSFRASAKIGFSRAWSAIRDGNLTSILSAIILFWFGTSIVKGFALVFGIGVLASMFSALLITRTLLMALPDTVITKGKMSKLYDSGIGFKKTK